MGTTTVIGSAPVVNDRCGGVMAACVVCGNDYDKSFQVLPEGGGEALVFDSFECAIHRLAPTCDHCGCRVIGHGTEVQGRIYCCANCARHAEKTNAPRDRVDEVVSDDPPAAPI
jgi:hypothetical protein